MGSLRLYMGPSGRGWGLSGSPPPLLSLQVSELGLEPDVLPVAADHPASRHRFLYANGTLHRMPTGLGWETPPLIPIPPHSVADKRAPPMRKGRRPDESIHSFTRRRFGAEVADLIADSLCRGVFAGDCRQLSVRSCFPALHRAERRRRSVIVGMATGGGGPIGPNDPNGPKGPNDPNDPNDPNGPVPAVLVRSRCERWSQWALRGGLQTLPESIATFVRLRGADVRCNAELQRLRLRSDRTWQLTLPDSTITADHVISALPAAALARVLPPEFHPLAQELTHIPAVTVAVVNLQYRGVTLPVTVRAHPIEPVRLGMWGYGDVVPQPHTGSHGGVPIERIRHFIEQQQLPLSLIGASYGGVSVNDCIASAKAAVGRLMGG
ncbi:LOW QUALITY PROTEIN: protoporphyrinogen oxidase [Coturnix japonica]|uniref:LOW QUALITY PROTEIN: protoporphyrinogen oxidase n=1 Tax=Coturnix japonica TaxID=93934 RepID=UPI0013A5CF7D|nr:LOW QUALITY PROTEIN: protoporphyrinogen oxidase [Coturnix japonica]